MEITFKSYTLQCSTVVILFNVHIPKKKKSYRSISEHTLDRLDGCSSNVQPSKTEMKLCFCDNDQDKILKLPVRLLLLFSAGSQETFKSNCSSAFMRKPHLKQQVRISLT